MFGWADANWLRVCGYVSVAVLAVVAARRGRGHPAETWKPFWVLTGGLFVVMALGRVGAVSDFLTTRVRELARSEGWYAARHGWQVIVVEALLLAFLLALIVVGLRMRASRPRYVPMTMIVLVITAYAAIRLVSLHEVDTLLHRHRYAGVRLGAIAEYGLLVAAGVCALWTSAPAHPEADELAPAPNA